MTINIKRISTQLNSLLIFHLLFFNFLTLHALGDELYVGPGHAHLTIQSAIDSCTEGDIIIVEEGTYNENINFSGKNITLKSTYPDDPAVVAATVIQGDGTSSVVTFANGESGTAVITGFTITGGYGTLFSGYGDNFYWGAGIYCQSASPTITSNIIAGNYAPLIEDDGQGNVTKLGLGGGIACINSNAIIKRNYIENNEAYYGAGIINSPGSARLANNFIYNNSGAIGGGVALFGGELSHNSVAGNDAVNGGNVYAAGDCSITHNIIANSVEGHGLYWQDYQSSYSVAYNNLWNNSDGNYSEIADQTGLNGNISEDPMFVFAEGNDYHLAANSPCINAGDPGFVPRVGETDIDGQSRVFSEVVDIGADEFTGYTIWYVDPDESIQQAIDDAVRGDVIIVNSGTYVENINFNGKAITLRSSNPDDINIVEATVIDGGGQGSVIKFINGEGDDTVLSGFTITGGYAMGPDSARYMGAGVYCLNSGPSINRCIFRDNTAGDAGGGMYCENSSATIEKCTFTNNSSYSGNGVNNNNSTTTLRDCEFIENIGGNVGGAVYCSNGSIVELTRCRFISNTSWTGAGIYVNDSNVDLYNCIFDGNSAGKDGGAVCSKFSNVAARNCLFTKNSADENGGAFDNHKGDVQLVNCTVISNTCQNLAGGIKNWNTVFRVTNCIVWNNTDSGSAIERAQIYYEYMIPVVNYSCIQDETMGDDEVYAGTGNIDEEPEFSSVDGYHLTVNSPCINSGDPAFVSEPGETDIDGEYRIMSDRVEMGADEYAGNTKPVADAGSDQVYNTIPELVELDGSGSYDPGGDSISYQWSQTSGPAVQLDGADTSYPLFVPGELGIYVFELIVSDGLLDSTADTVGIVIGNSAPVADAGSSRYAAESPVVLDGTGSYDPDGYGQLSFQWTQVSGAVVNISGEQTATPTISGFVQSSSVSECEFELIVSDGDLSSQASIVKVIIVPTFGTNTMYQSNLPFDPDKPTIVSFGGGNCNTGGGMTFGGVWEDEANWITVSSYGHPYTQYANMLIVYLSRMAPDYNKAIQTMGFSTGNMPALDVAEYINSTYSDARYAVNRVTLLDAACRSFPPSINSYLDSAVDGEQCWIDSYYATLSPYLSNTLNVRFPSPASHGTPVNWYSNSIYPVSWPNEDPYAGGISAGAYWSVIGPGRNLQLAQNTRPYYFQWVDDNPDYLIFYNQRQYPGKLPEPVTLLGPDDGAIVDAHGAVLTCQASENSVGYQLLVGPNSDNMTFVVSDSAEPPNEIVTEFIWETVYWTVKARDQHGSTIYADPKYFHPEVITDGPIENLNTRKTYLSIQYAIDEAQQGDKIEVQPGSYIENISFGGKNVILSSTEPNNIDTVMETIICGDGNGPVVSFSENEDTNCLLTGFTIRGGNNNFGRGGGVSGNGTQAVISSCVVTGNTAEYGGGICDVNGSIQNCVISNNTALKNGGGIAASDSTIVNCLIYDNNSGYGAGLNNCDFEIINCTVVNNNASVNAGGLRRCDGIITNCIVWGNSAEQLFECSEPAYCSIESWTGQGIGNIDEDPLFTDIIANDFHLLPGSPCIDAGDPLLDSSNEPWPNGSRINIGAYGNTSEAATSRNALVSRGLEIVSSTRINRTTFEYELALLIQNQNSYDVTDVQTQLVVATEAVIEVTDAFVTFAFISAGQTAVSDDTFRLVIDRANLIEPGRLTWELIYYEQNGGQATQGMSLDFDVSDLQYSSADITGEGYIDIADLCIISDQWLQKPGNPSADIAPTPLDNFVDYHDFAEFAKKWNPPQ